MNVATRSGKRMSPMRPAGAERRAAHGIGLIEILLTVLLLSIGFLAVARMQVQGMRMSQDAYNRSQAYFMAADMIDRMRSNVRGVLDGEYNAFDTAADVSDPGCGSKVCSPKEAAEQDLFDWSSLLHPTDGINPILPSSSSVLARGQIRSGAAGVYTITLFWSETRNGEEVQEDLTMNFATEIPG